MSMTLQELETIRYALAHHYWRGDVEDAIGIIRREIDQMKQDQLLSESKANPT